MNLWTLEGANRLQRREAPLPEHEDGKIRVRIAKVLVNDVDAAVYAGGLRVKYPLVPCRYSVGVVAEETDNSLFPKNTRVLPHAFLELPDSGTEKRDFSQDGTAVRGISAEGLLTDFVSLSPDEMTPLPASVSDERALTLHYVAAAKAIVDRLGAQRGQHVAVVGANVIGIFVCQLLIYQQAAPVLIDARPSRLDFARSCGIYYTLPADKTVVDALASITGGRLASGAVYVAGADGNDPDLPFALCAAGANVVVCGSPIHPVSVGLDAAIRKRLCIQCTVNGADYLETAINLVANRAVDSAAFRVNNYTADRAISVFETYADRPDRDTDELNVINLL